MLLTVNIYSDSEVNAFGNNRHITRRALYDIRHLDAAAKICAQYRGYNGAIIYINCYSDCCGDWSYRYCCASSSVNLYAVCAGLTLLGILIILIVAVCCRYIKRRGRRNEPGRNNNTDIPTITQSAIYSEPPAYSLTDPYRGYTNDAFPEVVTDYDVYMKPPDYQKDPPEYEKDPPTYNTVVSSSSSCEVTNSEAFVDTANNERENAS